jgi:hypothetical protein
LNILLGPVTLAGTILANILYEIATTIVIVVIMDTSPPVFADLLVIPRLTACPLGFRTSILLIQESRSASSSLLLWCALKQGLFGSRFSFGSGHV